MPKVTYSNGTTPNIAIIGAGFGGLTVAIQLKRLLGLSTFTIFEKNSDVGGVWFVNTYPGAATDLPGALYSWSFEPNPSWTAIFPSQTEILDYIRKTAKKYDLYTHLQPNTTVESAIWDNDIGQWKLTTSRDGEIEVNSFEIIVSAINVSRNSNIPEIFQTFKGPMMHTTDWRQDVDLNEKVVGVVGSGLSAVQLIPTILPQVKEMHSFQQSPTWICPRALNFKSMKIGRFINKNVPFFHKLFRWTVFWIHELTYSVTNNNSLLNRAAQMAGKQVIRVQTRKKPEIQEALIPSFPINQRHTPLSNNYLPALASPKTTLHLGNISDVTEDGVITESGEHVKLDIIIFTTSFKFQDFFAPLQIIGDKGSIMENWNKDRPKTFYGVTTSEAKNLFFVSSPYGLPGVTSAIFMMECQTKFIINFLRKMMKSEGIRQFRVTEAAEEEFMSNVDQLVKRTVWGCHDHGTLCTDDERNDTTYPGRAFSFWRGTRKVNMCHFHVFDRNSRRIRRQNIEIKLLKKSTKN